jgi:hypothetical protein
MIVITPLASTCDLKARTMNKCLPQALVIAVACACAGAARADDTAFLRSMSGSWSGTGTVKVRVNAPTLNIKCRFRSDTTPTSLSLAGTCTSLAVFSRAISADLKAVGSSYAGSYIGAGSGPAGLGGQRSGDVINLAITWAKVVNGDRRAQMSIERLGARGMRLTTIDTDPKTGKSVVTSRIDLRRT